MDSAGTDEFAVAAPRPAPSIASPLLLGLFMLMLAIFIVLVSYSTVAEHRFRSVVDSMTNSFHSAKATLDFAPAARDDDAPGTGNFPDLDRLIQAAAPGARREEAPAATRLQMAVPSAALFGRGRGTKLVPAGEALIVQLAGHLAAQAPDRRFEMEYLIGRGRESDWPLASARAAAVALALAAAGAPRETIAVGAMRGGVEMSAIVFQARP